MTDFLELRGKRIECVRIEGAEPTLVFLHEGLGSVGLWRDFPQALAERTGLSAFVYSRAGYGASDPAPLPRNVTYMHEEAELLPEILKTAGIADPVLVGHSDGASIAIIHAGRGGKARALVLLAPHVFTEEMGLRSIAQARVAYESGDLKRRLARWHGDVDAAFFGWNGAWLHPDFRKWNLEEFLPRIKAPILVVQGEDDEYGTKAQIDAIASGAASVRVALLAACGHSPHRDQPERTLSATEDFLRGLGLAHKR
jgi:pimeloyl-ACP methyl ester carboxylesterase